METLLVSAFPCFSPVAYFSSPLCPFAKHFAGRRYSGGHSVMMISVSPLGSLSKTAAEPPTLVLSEVAVDIKTPKPSEAAMKIQP